MLPVILPAPRWPTARPARGGRSFAGGLMTVAAATAAAVVMLIALCAARVPPSGQQPLMVVFPPWWRQADMLMAASAAGKVLGLGPAGFTVVLLPDRVSGPETLFRHGALLVTGADASWGCGLHRNTQSDKDYGA